MLRKDAAIYAMAFSLLATDLFGQESPQQEQTRASYMRFLTPDQQITPRLAPVNLIRDANALKSRLSPSTLGASQGRLRQLQEESVPLSDARAASNYAALLAEVASADETIGSYAQVAFWNKVAMDITAYDHTPSGLPVLPGAPPAPVPFDNVGPVRTARAMAIVHMAMFEAVNSAERKYVTYKNAQSAIFAESGLQPNIAVGSVSLRHAIGYAAYDTLRALYPRQQEAINRFMVSNLTLIPQIQDNQKVIAGVLLGQASARVLLQIRQYDGAELPDPNVDNYHSQDPKKWQRDPLNADPNVALGANWKHVKPFVITSAEQFRPVPPPTFDSTDPAVKARYIQDFNDVLAKGGDAMAGPLNPPGNANRRPTPTTRTTDEEFIGKFWAYDATALLCAPPRLYNMIATSIALGERKASFTNAVELARFLALVNVSMADAGLSAWEAKYHYFYPRPVTGIRGATPTTSPLTGRMEFWTPIGAPVSNAQPGRVNFTPPFPSYPSGHAVFGGAIFQVFRRVFGTDDVEFTFVSDEYNGLNRDAGATSPRQRKPVTFKNFSTPESDNARSRIYLGIHWQFDGTEGIAQGNRVATFVIDNLYMPLGS